MTNVDLTLARVTATLTDGNPAEAYAAAKLDAAITEFKANPTADEWKQLKRYMLVYQQAKLYPHTQIQENTVAAQDIDDAIVRATVGGSIDEILANDS